MICPEENNTEIIPKNNYFDSPILTSDYAKIALDRETLKHYMNNRYWRYEDDGSIANCFSIIDRTNHINIFNIDFKWPSNSDEILLTFNPSSEHESTFMSAVATINSKTKKCILERLEIDEIILSDKIIHHGIYYIIKSIYLMISFGKINHESFEYSLAQSA